VRRIDYLIFHISVSDCGDADEIRRWHIDGNGWDDIGYHWVILNPYKDQDSFVNKRPVILDDGRIESGRPFNTPGAHVAGYNWNSIGICFVGKGMVTGRQLISAKNLMFSLLQKGIITPDTKVMGHYEIDEHKTCPDIDADILREMFRQACDVHNLIANKTS
jgi:N-acetylmuramoyl-L-alanine amidase